ncbi:TlpA family protein disulfide reductase [Sphingomonas sp. G-3-2-10]|nr:TlpA family protein disulfide reductase [Sphingomonas sp. G-3-2-10]
MVLELSLRPVIALLLLAALGIGGCDRQSDAGSQANETIAAPASNDAAANETVEAEVIGTLDRSHKGESAPTIPFETPGGAKGSLADFRGKPVLLNLWATWCVPCVKEMPTLDALAVSLGDTAQVVVLSQDLDGAAKVTPFFQKANFKKLQPYLDTDAAFSLSMAVNLPTTILYDSNGKEVWRMLGGMDWTGKTARELIAEAK